MPLASVPNTALASGRMSEPSWGHGRGATVATAVSVLAVSTFSPAAGMSFTGATGTGGGAGGSGRSERTVAVTARTSTRTKGIAFCMGESWRHPRTLATPKARVETLDCGRVSP